MSVRSLYARFLGNDLRQNRSITLALIIVLSLSAFLMVSGAMVMERLNGSVERLFEVAKPPHFLQMHQGEYDPAVLEDFADQHPEIDQWLIQEMIGFDGQAISWHREGTSERGDLSASVIDNLFVVQNEGFDLLLGSEDQVVDPTPGTVYAPVAYQQQFDLAVGDELSVGGSGQAVQLEVAGFVRDAQMASSMASATRFVVSAQDFEALEQLGGSPEILVEYRLSDTADIAQLQRSYEANPDVPKNGQAVTEVMIRMVNMFSDGLVAIAFVLGSLLLILIALLSVRFVIRGALEDEIREIGAMKAIGLPYRSIRGLYLMRYGAMALVSCVLGGAVALLTSGWLTGNITANFAHAPVTLATVLTPLLAGVLVFVMVVTICSRVLGAVKKVDVVDALVHGVTESPRQSRKLARRAVKRAQRRSGSALGGAWGAHLNRRLAWQDLRSERGQWVLVPLVFALVAVLMSADSRIATVHQFGAVLYQADGEDGWESLRVEVGDYQNTSLEFLEGTAPEEHQIALSVLNAEKFEVSPGDDLTIRQDTDQMNVEVSGIYQDVTSGGFTAKMQGEITQGADRWVICADLVEGEDPAAVAEELDAAHQDAQVIAVSDYSRQTLAYAIEALRTVTLISLFFGLGSAVLISTLFMRLRWSKDLRSMGVLTALGFSAREIAWQMRTKMGIAVISGTVVGLIGAGLVGTIILTRPRPSADYSQWLR